ncbi:6-bladed beta-propeller, partial [bacterium]|nr:6-bladed beta-propeller [bacterium]
MKIKVKYLSIVLFLSISVLYISYGGQKAEWKGNIEKRDVITVIKNPKEPMYDEDVFSLVEELSIGETEGRKNYMFSMIVSIDVDEEGNIYVLDIKETHIKVFNSDGRLIRIIGRKGQGPGEFQRPFTIQITAKNEIVIFDPMPLKLLFFSSEGEYKKSISIEKLFDPPILDSEGNILSLVKVDVEENPKYELQKLDLELQPLT